MERVLGYKRRIRRDTLIKLFTSAYFIVSAIEIIAEYFNDTMLIYLIKPFIIPSLVLLYWFSSRKKNLLYVAALLLSLAANIFFVSRNFQSILIGAIFFFFHRALIIQIVLKHIRLPGIFPMIVGCIPFLFGYLYLIIMTYSKIDEGLIIFIVQCLLISFLGGISVGNYILRSSLGNTLLLLSTLLFAVTQFVFVLKLYYSENNIFQPLAMILFVLGQYLFCRFLLLAEKKKAGYEMRL